MSINPIVSYYHIIIFSKSFYFFTLCCLWSSICCSRLFILSKRGSKTSNRGSKNSSSFFLNSPFKLSSSYSIFSLILPIYFSIVSFSSNSMSAISWSTIVLAFTFCAISFFCAKTYWLYPWLMAEFKLNEMFDANSSY